MSCDANDNDGYNLIFSGGERGAANMAEDLHILNRYRHLDDFTVCPTLRLYFFSPPALSLGFFQNKLDGELIKRAKSQGYDIVRRPTGGRAVLHLNEITYSVAASYKSGIFAGRLMETYRIISDFLYNFFLKIGLSPDIRAQNFVNNLNSVNNISNTENNNKNFNCFLKAHSYEITFSGKKICGNSQRRNDTAFLQHGSIYIDYNPEEHCELFENNLVGNGNKEVNIDKDDECKNKLNIFLESKKEYNRTTANAKDYKDYAEKITGIKQELLKKNAGNSKDPKKQIAHDYGTLLDKNKLLNVLKTSFEETYNLKSIDYKFKDTEISEIDRLAEIVFIA
jgi:lipoate-protein ligase A